MTRVLVVDDQPAMSSAPVGAFRADPGLVPLVTADSMSGAREAADRRAVDVALVDYPLADGDGLMLCRELKQLASPPAVLIYSAFPAEELLLGAIVAGADGLLDNGASVDELLDAVRILARGGKTLPAIRPGAVAPYVARLDRGDLPVLGLRVDGATDTEIAAVLRVDEGEVRRRLGAMLDCLAVSAAVPSVSR